MKRSTKQKQTHGHREQTCACQGEEGREWDGLECQGQQMQTIIFRMDKQQGPTVWHRELYAISWENHDREYF